VKKSNFNFIDVFSGAGGLSCGMEQAGLRCLLGIDFDRYAIETFAQNHQHAETYCGDVKKLDAVLLKKLLKGQEVHAVVGGPPCQGFSTVGIGNPNDLRNSLFLEFVRIVRETKPQFVVIENVTGLLAKKNEKTLRAIFAQFENLGFHLDVQVLSSEHYGTPEIRRRTIILGTRLNVDIHFPIKTHKVAVTVGEALKNLIAKNNILYNHDLNDTKIKSKLDLARIKHIPEGKGIRYAVDEENYLPKKLKLNIDWEKLPEGRFRQTKYQRLDGKKASPTIMTHKHNYFHPTENRYLTAREAAKLQSFPNDFIFKGPLSAQWKQIGNAVPPMLGTAIAKALISMLKLAQKDQSKIRKVPVREQITDERGRAFSYKNS
jgi:DNA (cytosine-5)-methyltransferase 1